MHITFENQVALVTGAGSGLGLATATAFAAAGASVVLADVDVGSARSAAHGLVARGHRAIAVRCDVSDDAQVEAMVDRTVATFGRLDATFNNAGIQNVLADAADAPRDDYDRVMAVNLQGVWSCMKFELQQMRKQGSGAIVNCSSIIGGLVGGAQRGTYHAAKHGVLGLTKSAAPGVRRPGHPGERRLPGHDPDAEVRPDDRRRPKGGFGRHARAGADRPARPTRRDRRRRALAVQRPVQPRRWPVDRG